MNNELKEYIDEKVNEFKENLINNKRKRTKRKRTKRKRKENYMGLKYTNSS